MGGRCDDKAPSLFPIAAAMGRLRRENPEQRAHERVRYRTRKARIASSTGPGASLIMA